MVVKTKRPNRPTRWLRGLTIVGLLLSSGWAMAARAWARSRVEKVMTARCSWRSGITAKR